MKTKPEVNKSVFSERLKYLMGHKNETIYTLADILHLSPPTISRYSNAEMAPKITTIEVLANYFNVSPVWLMGYDVPKALPNTTSKPNDDTIATTDSEKSLLKKYKSLDNKGKHTVDTVADMEYNRVHKPHLVPVAAHEIEGASEDDKQHDDDIMNDDKEWE